MKFSQNPAKICQLPILQKLLCSELKMLQADQLYILTECYAIFLHLHFTYTIAVTRNHLQTCHKLLPS